MSSKWNYGDAYKRYPIENEIHEFEDGSMVKVHDIFNPLPKFMKAADVIFVDPPWNQGNMTSFYTKAEMINPHRYESFYDRLFECIKEMDPNLCFVEVGKEHLADFIIRMRKLFKNVTFYNSSYYHDKNKICYVVQGSKKRVNYKLDYMDEEDIIKWICENIEYECIGDLCMGRGLVGLHSYINGKRFVGTELNHKRLSVLVERIEQSNQEVGNG